MSRACRAPSTRAPAARTTAAKAGPLPFRISAGPGVAVTGTSSSPVATRRARGHAKTSSCAAPTDAATPIAVLAAALLAGCTGAQTNWTPTMDTYGNSNAQYVSRDLHECRQLAMQSSGDSSGEAAGGALGGAAVGAAAGAAIGAVFGSAGAGAAVGAAAGGLGYGTHKGLQSEEQFKRAYATCMRNRGHNVLD